MGGRTGITTSHQEHGNIATTNGEGRNADDIAENDAPPGRTVVEEPLASAIYSLYGVSPRFKVLKLVFLLPACHALMQHTAVATIHGGL